MIIKTIKKQLQKMLLIPEIEINTDNVLESIKNE
mgnify:FL=1